MDDQHIHFTLRPARAGVSVICRVGDEGPIQAKFDFELTERIRGVIDGIAAGCCSQDDLRDVGAQLWAGLRAGDIGQALDARRDTGRRWSIWIDAVPELAILPWEALYDENRYGFLAIDPDHCILRASRFNRSEPRGSVPSGEDGMLGILAVVPEGSGLIIDNELKNLDAAMAGLGGGRVVDRLRGAVTPDVVKARLDEGDCDIVHFIGHGELRKNGPRIRLNRDDGEDLWVPAEQFASIFQHSCVSLVVLNCCYGGEASLTRGLDGMGPALLRSGVRAVVAMRYPIQDDAATRFARAFYNHLLRGKHRGRIDVATQEARSALYRNIRDDDQRSFVTPVLYLATGGEQLSGLAEPPRVSATCEVTAAMLGAPAGGDVPEALLSAFKTRRCIPVIGPGIIPPPTERRFVTPPGLRSLIEQLSIRCEYPNRGELAVAEQLGQWMTELQLQRIAQYFESRRQRFALAEAILEACSRTAPTPAHGLLSTWDVPCLFYLHVDGLLEEALESTRPSAGRAIRYITKLDTPPEIHPEEDVCVLVRGSVRDLDSLVLTEHDHRELGYNIAAMAPPISDRTRQFGRSLLFIGADPDETTVRQLAAKLLLPPAKNQAAPFFVWPEPSPAQECFWSRFRVEWIRREPLSFIRDVSDSIHG